MGLPYTNAVEPLMETAGMAFIVTVTATRAAVLSHDVVLLKLLR